MATGMYNLVGVTRFKNATALSLQPAAVRGVGEWEDESKFDNKPVQTSVLKPEFADKVLDRFKAVNERHDFKDGVEAENMGPEILLDTVETGDNKVLNKVDWGSYKRNHIGFVTDGFKKNFVENTLANGRNFADPILTADDEYPENYHPNNPVAVRQAVANSTVAENMVAGYVRDASDKSRALGTLPMSAIVIDDTFVLIDDSDLQKDTHDLNTPFGTSKDNRDVYPGIASNDVLSSNWQRFINKYVEESIKNGADSGEFHPDTQGDATIVKGLQLRGNQLDVSNMEFADKENDAQLFDNAKTYLMASRGQVNPLTEQPTDFYGKLQDRAEDVDMQIYQQHDSHNYYGNYKPYTVIENDENGQQPVDEVFDKRREEFSNPEEIEATGPKPGQSQMDWEIENNL